MLFAVVKIPQCEGLSLATNIFHCQPTLREERRRESRGRGQERWARVADGGWGEREDIWNSLGRRGEREITL